MHREQYTLYIITMKCIFHLAGAIQFEHVMKTLGQDDPEVARLHAQVRSYFLPAVVIPPSGHP